MKWQRHSAAATWVVCSEQWLTVCSECSVVRTWDVTRPTWDVCRLCQTTTLSVVINSCPRALLLLLLVVVVEVTLQPHHKLITVTHHRYRSLTQELRKSKWVNTTTTTTKTDLAAHWRTAWHRRTHQHQPTYKQTSIQATRCTLTTVISCHMQCPSSLPAHRPCSM